MRADKRDRIPAVVHVDNTCRIQVVSRRMSLMFHALLSAFGRRTGVPILLNTSFNDSELIVCTPKDALHTFGKTKIERVVLGRFMVSRVTQRPA